MPWETAGAEGAAGAQAGAEAFALAALTGAAGASFFFTQPLFCKEDAEKVRLLKKEVPQARILCGIMPLISRRNAVFMKNEMVGIHVPEEIINRYGENMTREQGEETGITIAKEIMAMTADFADGFYFSLPFNRVHVLEKILKETSDSRFMD